MTLNKKTNKNIYQNVKLCPKFFFHNSKNNSGYYCLNNLFLY